MAVYSFHITMRMTLRRNLDVRSIVKSANIIAAAITIKLLVAS